MPKQGKGPAVNYQALYLRTPMMMHSIDPFGRLVAVSDFWLQTLGYEREEVLGRPLTDFFTESSRNFAAEIALPRFFLTGKARDVPYQMLKKNGDVIDVLISATAERDENSNIVCSMAGIVDVTEQKKAEQEVQRLAHYDSLTGQPNRYLLHDRLQHALAQADREGHKVGVMFVDLDRFKWVNDTLGHAAGDAALVEFARRLRACVRGGDLVARHGGEEFFVAMPDTGRQVAEQIAERVRDSVQNAAFGLPDGGSLGLTVSVGVAISSPGQSANTLLCAADAALYRSKSGGRNRVTFAAAA